MMAKDPRLVLQAAPLLRQQLTTQRAMLDVLIALVPATLAGLWFFGIGGLLVLLACILGCILTEWAFSAAEVRRKNLLDGSGVLTGLLLGLTLPPSLPLWMAFVGGMVAIGLGKLIWGGLGQNLFNPALVGRAFLLATFPIAMTTWTSAAGPGQFFEINASNLAAPFMHVDYDGVSSATPLGLMKFESQGNLYYGFMYLKARRYTVAITAYMTGMKMVILISLTTPNSWLHSTTGSKPPIQRILFIPMPLSMT